MRFTIWLNLVLVMLAESLTYSATLTASLETIVNGNASQTVEDFLKSLPPELKSRPVLLYKSQSLQTATYKAPRVLLSQPNGLLVLAFNGQDAREGSDKVESMEYDAAAAKFIFRELSFSSAGIDVSKANPPQCMTCHRGSDPRPIWESYDRWPGAFGSSDDSLTSEEFEPFVEFLNSAATTPRYDKINLDHLLPVATKSNFLGRLPFEPNITFTHTLSRLNFKRIARLIAETPDYARFKYAVAGGLGCDSVNDMLPDAYQAASKYYTANSLAEARMLKNSFGDEYVFDDTLSFRSVFESRGIDTSDWFMNFKGGLTNTFLNGSPWAWQILNELLANDTALKFFLLSGSAAQLSCSTLADKSLESIGSLPPPSTLKTLQTDPEAGSRIWHRSCASCHEVKSATDSPQFSYAEAQCLPTFSQRILSGDMPRDQKLTPGEQLR
ncbi:MAG: hypothetical protein NTV34_04390, partial [Proteobacteria bacterium]|nr:hypothetical protein [Pseudomonadota bacterium]